MQVIFFQSGIQFFEVCKSESYFFFVVKIFEIDSSS